MVAMARFLGLALLLVLARQASPDVAGCGCDPDDAASLSVRQCSLTREAIAQPDTPAVFFLKDVNPNKPNRMLALPKTVRKGVHSLSDLTPQERQQFWASAMQKAQELWGSDWGLAFNGDEVRTQCQPHIHIGKFLTAAETRTFIVVDGPAQIPVPKDGGGLWVHPQGGKLHVHLGEDLTETTLRR